MSSFELFQHAVSTVIAFIRVAHFPRSSSPNSSQHQHSGSEDTDSDDDTQTCIRPYVLCTRPPTGAVEDGSSECFLSNRAIDAIESNADRGYPHELLHPLEGPSYAIAPSPGKGRGLFATRDISLGNLVSTERALLIGPVPRNGSQLLLTEQQVLQCFRKLGSEAKSAYLGLRNEHRDLGTISGIFKSNALEIYGLNHVDEGTSYGGVFKDLSLVNHSCRPNASLSFDLTTFAMRLTAIRDIKAGEELCITYCALEYNFAADRQYSLPFDCVCNACQNAEMSDFRRRQIFSINPWELVDAFYSWIKDGTTAYPGRLENLKNLIEEEGLEDSWWYRLVLKQMCGVGFAFDDEEVVMEYLQLLYKAFLAGGMTRDDVIDILEKAECEYLPIIGVQLGPGRRYW